MQEALTEIKNIHANIYFSYLNWEGLSTIESGSSRKCVWLMFPVRVSMVTTGKPIWRVQQLMMSLTERGIPKPGVLSTA